MEFDKIVEFTKGGKRAVLTKLEIVERPDDQPLDNGGEAIGIHARAEIHIPFEAAGKAINLKIDSISSGGLWGIEAEADKAYKTEIAKEELDDLHGYLQTLHVNTETFALLRREALEAIN